MFLIINSKRVAIFFLFFVATPIIQAQEFGLIPYPTHMEKQPGKAFSLTPKTAIVYTHENLQNEAKYLQNSLQGNHQIKLVSKGKLVSKIIKLELNTPVSSEDESYKLAVSERGINISANTPKGVFYGIQTLLQLLPTEVYSKKRTSYYNWFVPALKISDNPVFKWRGMHLDVARNFRSVAFVKQFIDYLAYHKFNTFHWHLTEDQGWRIEIKKYPLLTEVGAFRDSTLIGHMRDKPWKYKRERVGGFYTQEEIKDIVEYAKQRHITVVPEIEMPGHAQAAIAAYPAFGNTGVSPGVRPVWGISHEIYNPEMKTINFLKDILDEVLLLFPSKYIHIGGDEAKKTLWESSEKAQALLKERGLKDMHAMQSWFVSQIGDYLKLKNRTLIGWDEILEGGLGDNAVVMSWRGDAGAIEAVKQNHQAIMANSKYTYLNKYQSQDKNNEPLANGGFLPLKMVYSYNPIPKALSIEESKYILGAQGQLWSEYITSDDHMEYMMFPRATALAEVLWNNTHKKPYDNFIDRLRLHMKRLDKLEINYRKPEELHK